jgi:peptidyl-prolyl cis-trans isomerase SurA
VRRQIERSFMAMEYMRGRIFEKIEQIGYNEIKEYYEEHPGEFQVEDRITWQDIFVSANDVRKYPTAQAARQMAEQILARVRRGEDFVKLAKEFDDGLSRYSPTAEGYGQRRGEIKPVEAEPILFRMKDGETAPVLEMATGFHILHLVKREYAGLRPLQDTKTQDDIHKKLTNIVADREFKRIVTDLRKNAQVVRDNEP